MSRRKAREAALQVLFQIEMAGVEEEKAYEYIFSEFNIGENAQKFCRELVQGTLRNRAYIDDIIREVSNEWDLYRMANVDRNIIRMALYEMLFREDVPKNVAINEAIELGKDFSTADSGKFINGILGYVAKNMEQFKRTEPGV
ncbi:transcription antitermination factor NusB [Thermincola potens]|uniref:Transcription antitermination protein NusB n=1 Tax=Thermincola potens (strain JR) TaxID=635013 RepID=D5X7J4_THEPJ|nr:transcription antitermination factor NusB [Thermincola potens]ADG82564.1 NusB antitermination factor [Thermincola potens JR]